MIILLQYSFLIRPDFQFNIQAFSRVSITGPQYVVAGTVYQYSISGNRYSSLQEPSISMEQVIAAAIEPGSIICVFGTQSSVTL